MTKEELKRFAQNQIKKEKYENEMNETMNVKNYKKALDEACEFLSNSSQDCPANLGLSGGKKCDKCNGENDIAECWKELFLADKKDK